MKRVAKNGIDSEMGLQSQVGLLLRKPEFSLVIVKNIQRVRVAQRAGRNSQLKRFQLLAKVVTGAEANHIRFEENFFAVNVLERVLDFKMHKGPLVPASTE